MYLNMIRDLKYSKEYEYLLLREKLRAATLLAALEYIARGPRPDDSDQHVARKAIDNYNLSYKEETK